MNAWTDLSTKKTGMKREPSPHTPYKRKARGKENKPGILGPGLYARARTRKRDPWLKKCIAASVERALVVFHGKRHNPALDKHPELDPCDERLWANFAKNLGYGKLDDAIDQGISEMAQHDTPVPDAKKPAILQNILTKYWQARFGGNQ